MDAIGDYDRSLVNYNPLQPDLEGGGKGQLRVLSYNVYADVHCDTPEMTHSSTKSWKVRAMTLLNEVTSYDADVVLLQDIDHFRDFWQPRFAERRYDCVFKQRTEFKSRHPEGVAIAYKRDNLQLFKSVPLEFNEARHFRSDISRDLYDGVQNDDVALIAFLQPWRQGFLNSAICVVSAQLCDKDGQLHTLVRALEVEALTRTIEKANLEFQVPVMIGISLFDEPDSPAYHILRTGRQPIRPEMPRKPNPPKLRPLCRGTVRLTWRTPLVTIADPPVLSYKVCWRPGGSTTLSFRTERSLAITECIQYVKRKDSSGVMRTVALDDLAINISGLASEMPYEFKVCAVNEVGSGVWSDATPVCILRAPNPERVPPMPKAVWLKSIDQVHEMREEQAMADDDFDVAKASSQQAYSETHLTPRLMDGTMNSRVSRARVLPLSANAREGWNKHVRGQGSEDLTKFMSKDKRLRSSILRDMQGKFTVDVADASDGRKAYLVEDDSDVEAYEATVRMRATVELEQEEEARAALRRKLDDAMSRKSGSTVDLDNGSVRSRGTLTTVGLDHEHDASAIMASASVGDIDGMSIATLEIDGTLGADEGEGDDNSMKMTTDDARNERVSESENPPHELQDLAAADKGEEDVNAKTEGMAEDVQGPSSPTPTIPRLSFSLAESLGMDMSSLAAGASSVAPGGEALEVSIVAEGDAPAVDDPWLEEEEEESLAPLPGKANATKSTVATTSSKQTIISRYLPKEDAHLGVVPGVDAGEVSHQTEDDVLLDGDAITRHLGISDIRQVHSMPLRSLYERYSPIGEPAFTFVQPREGDHCPPPRGAKCIDYVFYTHELLRPRRLAVLPTLGGLLSKGDDPRESPQMNDPIWVQPPRRLEKLYTEFRLPQKKPTANTAMQKGLGSSSSHVHVSQGEISRLKSQLARHLSDPNKTNDIWAGSWMPPATMNAFRRNSGLPNGSYCSSHLALVGEFDVDDTAQDEYAPVA